MMHGINSRCGVWKAWLSLIEYGILEHVGRIGGRAIERLRCYQMRHTAPVKRTRWINAILLDERN